MQFSKGSVTLLTTAFSVLTGSVATLGVPPPPPQHPFKDADIGILSSHQQSSIALLSSSADPPQCTKGFVDCVNGYVGDYSCAMPAMGIAVIIIMLVKDSLVRCAKMEAAMVNGLARMQLSHT